MKTTEIEVLPKETAVVKGEQFNSEKLRSLAAEAVTFHLNTKMGAELMVVNALACGDRLIQAKALLPHGQFLKWMDKYLGIPRSTAFNYMTLMERVRALNPGKCPTDGHLLQAPAQAFTQDYIKKIMPKVRELVEGRSLQQLYFDFGIIKPRQTKGLKAQRRLDEAKKKIPDTSAALAHCWVEDTIAKLAYAKDFTNHITDDDLNALARALDQAKEDLGILKWIKPL